MIIRKRTFGSLVLAAAALTLMATPHGSAQVAGPEVFIVDDVLVPGVPSCEQTPTDHVTIQDAVDAAATSGSPGEKVVRVCPGVYSEYVVVPAPMTIEGAQAGNDARQRTTASTPLDEESFLTGPDEPPANGVPAGFFLTASDITIDGFYLGGFNDTLSSGVSGSAIHTNPQVGAHLIQNNMITGNTFGMNLHGSGGSVIRRNQFRSNNQPGGASGTGIYSDQGFLNSSISENSFINNNAQGIVLLEAPGVVEGITIDGNHFQGNGRSVVLGLTERVTLRDNVSLDSIGNGFVLEGGNVGTIIEDNAVSGAYSGLVLTKDYCCGPAAINTGTIVRENSFTGNAQNGIHVHEGGASSTTIRENHFRSNLTGIRLVGSPTPAMNPAVVANRISGNGAGMVNGSSTVTVLAENNWWGCNGGPSQAGCDTAAPRITSAPWIVMKLTSSKTALAPQETAVITADLTKNSAGGSVPGSSLPDDTMVVFNTDRGSLSERRVLLGSDGVATTVLQHTDGAGGNARVSAELDNEEESVTVAMSGPSPSPSPSTSTSPSPSASVTPSPSPSPSASPSPTPSPSVSPSPSPSSSVSPSPSPTPTPSVSTSPSPGTSPTPVSYPECSDGLDNDGDGEVDHPADEDCVNPEDDDESHLDPEPTCPGYEGDDRNQIVGTTGDDTLDGTEGDDIICTFGGDDTISGLGGDDLILSGRGNDQISAGDGDDVVRSSAGNDRVRGSLGRDVLYGGSGPDSIRGGSEADRLFGGRGSDVLRGGKGRDRIDGSPGRDTCIGGTGRNLYKDCELGRGRQS
jgi:parallel beta-helix repeat protein